MENNERNGKTLLECLLDSGISGKLFRHEIPLEVFKEPKHIIYEVRDITKSIGEYELEYFDRKKFDANYFDVIIPNTMLVISPLDLSANTHKKNVHVSMQSPLGVHLEDSEVSEYDANDESFLNGEQYLLLTLCGRMRAV